MEIILAILFFIFFGWIVRAVLSTLRAAGKAAIGKGSLKDNLELEFRGMGALRIRITPNQKPDEPFFLGVEVRGLFPVYSNTNAGFVISVFVKNDEGDLAPVLSMIQEFQEPGSRAFQDLTGCGEVSDNQGFINWVQIGVIPTEILQPPNGGKHQLNIVVRLVDMNNMPSIDLGYSEPSESLWTGLETYDYNFEVSGYREEAEHKDKAQSLTIKIGMAVAMADGALDNSEGNILKNWIVSALSHHTGEKRESMKKTYNDAMKEAYDLAKMIHANFKSLKRARIILITNGECGAIPAETEKAGNMEITFQVYDFERLWRNVSSGLKKEVITLDFEKEGIYYENICKWFNEIRTQKD